ncbi:peptidyl-prolyl cis-trans isomerase FKBP2 isoform X1 [Ahaetulla prasina]|uniref:peptidyl-prolyl cis-trans isomerase FKBP2 isoform X1 n=1 Tax=Ahaetulla prasina TaxID=499056 RepID=UPI0026492770|nr:peptidyl-prolyl cis-trans isomerase FKBP2 isoform X1 [Ahaetulla prasina]
MQTNLGTALLTLALWVLCSPGLSTEGKRKLQIGVKKRVDNCPIKSRKGDVLHMHYTGKLEDGTEFDSSLTRDQPFIFSLGTGQVIKGWEQGLLGMCEGEKRKLVIPSELGYGDRGAPPKIPGTPAPTKTCWCAGKLAQVACRQRGLRLPPVARLP